MESWPEQALTNALVESTWTGSWMISTQLGGWFIEKHGFAIPMMIAVCLYLVASSLYLYFFRDVERRLRLHVRNPTEAMPVPGDRE
jgi:hypothetical protein